MSAIDLQALERELGAAQRTVDVLKERVHAMQSGSRTTIQRQLDASKRREDEGRRRRELAEVRAAELARHSAGLEAEVARRTMAMRRILNNVTFGFLVVNRALVVQPEATDSCTRLFDAQNVEGKSLLELLRLTGRAATTFELCMDQVFEDVLGEQAALGQLPADFRIGHRTIRAEGSAVRDSAGAIEGILFTISDVTDLLAAQRESAENKVLLSILRNRDTFESFVEDVRTMLADAARALDKGDDVTVRRIVHTIKGNAASYDLFEVVNAAHRAEEGVIVLESLIALRDAMVAFLQRHHVVLGMTFECALSGSVHVSTEQVSALKHLVRKLGSPELRIWAATVTERSADVLLGPIDAFARRLGERLGKSVDVEVEGRGTMMDDERMRPVMQTLVHLVRNAVDHGIEPPGARGVKAATGKITIAMSASPQEYVVSVRDDGAGLDLDLLGARAQALGLVNAESLARMSDDERRRLVFLDGVSTAGTLSDVSGRGVGMSAVLAAVSAANGHIAVASTPRVGTTFVLTVPRPRLDGGRTVPPQRRSSLPAPA